MTDSLGERMLNKLAGPSFVSINSQLGWSRVYPKSLMDWTIDSITDVLDKGLFESEGFDFKEYLPRDDSGKRRIRSACAALANSAGGFLVFGISDDRTKCSSKRLVGLDPNLDFPCEFGDFPRLCIPSVEWDFRNPPIHLGSGRVIHVVFIPRSWKAPHATGAIDSGWRFYKRTNKGDEGMNIDEIRSAFGAYYEKRLRLQLLRAELLSLRDYATGAASTAIQGGSKKYSLVTFDIAVIESIIADTYPLTASAPEFLAVLSKIRHLVRIANNKSRIFFGAVVLPLDNQSNRVQAHNEFMGPFCESMASLCTKAMELLDSLLKP